MNKPGKVAEKSPPSSYGAGRRLAAARENWGLSVQEAAEYLNLSPETITAIEQDAYHRLPDSTFAKGYLRAYAKLLKLDQDEIIASTSFDPNNVPGNPHKLATLKRSTYRAYPRRKKRGGVFFLVLIIAVLAGLTMAVYRAPDFSVNQLLEKTGLPAQFSEIRKSFSEMSFFTDNRPAGALEEPRGATE